MVNPKEYRTGGGRVLQGCAGRRSVGRGEACLARSIVISWVAWPRLRGHALDRARCAEHGHASVAMPPGRGSYWLLRADAPRPVCHNGTRCRRFPCLNGRLPGTGRPLKWRSPCGKSPLSLARGCDGPVRCRTGPFGTRFAVSYGSGERVRSRPARRGSGVDPSFGIQPRQPVGKETRTHGSQNVGFR